MQARAALVVFASILLTATRIAMAAEHPGNMFLAGDDVIVPLPAGWPCWSAIDIDGKNVGHGEAHDGKAELGKLPIGYFEIRQKDGPGMITAGVIGRNEGVENTPIALDAAVSWFYPDSPQLRDACALARMTGVRWVRDPRQLAGASAVARHLGGRDALRARHAHRA